jgi:hypothetical protein
MTISIQTQPSSFPPNSLIETRRLHQSKKENDYLLPKMKIKFADFLLVISFIPVHCDFNHIQLTTSI